MERSSRQHSRPVGDLPVAELRDGTEIAKRWLIELIACGPLSAAQTLSTADFVRSGPSLCAAMVDALGSDAALELLGKSSTSADAGRMTGAADALATAVAVEALRVAFLSSLRAKLSEPSAELASAVSDRVSAIVAVVLARSLGGAASQTVPSPTAQEAPAPIHEAFAPIREAPASIQDPPPVVPEPDEPITVSKPTADPWLVAIDRWIDQAERDDTFAVLTAEIDDVDRLVASSSGREVAVAIEAAERSLIGALAPADVLIRERVGRYWVVSPAADSSDARDLGEQLAAAVSETAMIAGTPLTASVGLAMYPVAGETAEALAARADEGLFAARSAGIRIA